MLVGDAYSLVLMSVFLLLSCFLSFCFGVSSLSNDTCTKWTNCPVSCTNGTSEVDLLSFLVMSDQPAALAFFRNAHKAIEIIRSFGDVVDDDLLYLHTTIAYLCCYGDNDYNTLIFPALHSVVFSAFNITFNTALHCNYDYYTNHDNATTSSLVVLLSNETQQQLMKLTQQLQGAITRITHLPVIPRSQMEPFHVTLAVVKQHYPVQKAIQKVSQEISSWTDHWGPIQISQFESLKPPQLFKARNN